MDTGTAEIKRLEYAIRTRMPLVQQASLKLHSVMGVSPGTRITQDVEPSVWVMPSSPGFMDNRMLAAQPVPQMKALENFTDCPPAPLAGNTSSRRVEGSRQYDRKSTAAPLAARKAKRESSRDRSSTRSLSEPASPPQLPQLEFSPAFTSNQGWSPFTSMFLNSDAAYGLPMSFDDDGKHRGGQPQLQSAIKNISNDNAASSHPVLGAGLSFPRFDSSPLASEPGLPNHALPGAKHSLMPPPNAPASAHPNVRTSTTEPKRKSPFPSPNKLSKIPKIVIDLSSPEVPPQRRIASAPTRSLHTRAAASPALPGYRRVTAPARLQPICTALQPSHIQDCLSRAANSAYPQPTTTAVFIPHPAAASVTLPISSTRVSPIPAYHSVPAPFPADLDRASYFHPSLSALLAAWMAAPATRASDTDLQHATLLAAATDALTGTTTVTRVKRIPRHCVHRLRLVRLQLPQVSAGRGPASEARGMRCELVPEQTPRMYEDKPLVDWLVLEIVDFGDAEDAQAQRLVHDHGYYLVAFPYCAVSESGGGGWGGIGAEGMKTARLSLAGSKGKLPLVHCRSRAEDELGRWVEACARGEGVLELMYRDQESECWL